MVAGAELLTVAKFSTLIFITCYSRMHAQYKEML